MSLNSLNLEKTYGKKIMFKKMETHGKFESYLVASSDIFLRDCHYMCL
jgi:phage terminase large subunit